MGNKITVRKISAITDEVLLEEFDSNNIPDSSDLDTLIKGLNDELKRTLDVLAGVV